MKAGQTFTIEPMINAGILFYFFLIALMFNFPPIISSHKFLNRCLEGQNVA